MWDESMLLAEMCYRVYTIERIRSLMIKAKSIIEELGLHNVFFRVGDGTLGWSEQAPYEAIIVTAGSPEIPEPLIKQLAPGGRLVIPVGKSRISQSLIKLTKSDSGRIKRHNLGGCRFVDLVGDYGWSAGGGR